MKYEDRRRFATEMQNKGNQILDAMQSSLNSAPADETTRLNKFISYKTASDITAKLDQQGVQDINTSMSRLGTHADAFRENFGVAALAALDITRQRIDSSNKFNALLDTPILGLITADLSKIYPGRAAEFNDLYQYYLNKNSSPSPEHTRPQFPAPSAPSQ